MHFFLWGGGGGGGGGGDGEREREILNWSHCRNRSDMIGGILASQVLPNVTGECDG